jgi:hypothetical protein
MAQGAQLNGITNVQCNVLRIYLHYVKFCLLMMGLNLQPLCQFVSSANRVRHFQREGTMGVCHDILQNVSYTERTNLGGEVGGGTSARA